MKSLIAILLFSISASATEAAVWTDDQYALSAACEAREKLLQVAKPCQALIDRANSGRLIRESEFNNWCGMATAFGKEMKKQEAIYKSVKHKALDYKKCPGAQ